MLDLIIITLIPAILALVLAMMIVCCLFDRERTEESIAVQVQILPVMDCRTEKKGPKKVVSIKKKKKVMTNSTDNQMKIVLNRLENLEGALMEKDVEIRKLEKMVQSLQRKSNIPQPKAIKIDTETSKSSQNTKGKPKRLVNRAESVEPKIIDDGPNVMENVWD